jgi:hypothetical protein
MPRPLPIKNFSETTIPKATRTDITTFVTNFEMRAFNGVANLVTGVYAVYATNPTTRASTKNPATTTKVTTLGASKKLDAQRKIAEKKTKVKKMALRIDKPQACPHN